MQRTATMERDGIVGELLVPADPEASVCVVVVAGFFGGMSHRPIAQALARDGFPALALAHFAAEGLPPRMENIPLEYFVDAAEWLRAQPEVRDHRLVVMGNSRGAELALQLAARFDVFDGSILTSPSSVRFPAPGGRVAAWSVDGAPLPFVRMGDTPPTPPEPRVIDGKAYSRSAGPPTAVLDGDPSVEPARIRVEDVHGPVLMFAGREDDLWPSAAFADQIEARAARLGLTHRVDNVQYEAVGHNIPVPGHPLLLRTWNAERGVGMSFGGEEGATLAAASDRWNRIKAHLKA